MSDIHRVLRAAAWRLGLATFLDALVKLTTAALLALLLLRVTQQVFAFEVAWWTVGTWAPVGVLAGALAWTVVMRPRQAAVARRVDEGADLRDTLSTALAVAGDQNPWSRNVVESASAAAKRVDVGRALPMRAPRHWSMPLFVGAAVVLIWVVFPSFDLLGRRAQAEQKKEDERALKVAKAEASDATKKLEELVAKVAPEVKADQGATAKVEEAKPATPEEIRRSAMKQITSMADQLEQMRGGEKGMQHDAMKQMMRQLKPPGPGPLSEVSQAMAKGDFKEAQQALQALQQKMAAGQMSESDKRAMQKQLEKMAQQLAQMAKNKAALEKKLADAGLDPKLAGNPEQLAQALAQSQSMSQQQKDALSEMAKAQEAASQACQSMSQSMQQMAAGQKPEGMNAQGQQGMQQLADQLSQMEMMQAEAQSLDAALAEAKYQLDKLGQAGQCSNPGMGECQTGLAAGDPRNGQWQAGDSNNRSNGSGGAGQGNGGGPGEQAAEENWTKRRVKTTLGAGPTIGTTYIQGEQVRGESKAEFVGVVQEASQQATEAMESNTIPREYHESVKAFFGRLSKKVQAQPGAAPTATPAPAPAAGDAKGAAGKGDVK